jgi:hypothetical protein
MRRSCVVWALLLLIVAIPALRHASVPDAARSGQASIQHAPRSAPSAARTAAVTLVTVEVPAPVVVAVALSPAPPRTPARLIAAPHAPLRL